MTRLRRYPCPHAANSSGPPKAEHILSIIQSFTFSCLSTQPTSCFRVSPVRGPSFVLFFWRSCKLASKNGETWEFVLETRFNWEYNDVTLVIRSFAIDRAIVIFFTRSNKSARPLRANASHFFSASYITSRMSDSNAIRMQLISYHLLSFPYSRTFLCFRLPA
jgi:hypothetical protein